MPNKIKPLPPIKKAFRTWDKIKLYFLSILNILLWIVIFVTGINLLSYYIHSLVYKGFFDPETLKYSLILIIGAYFFLIIDKDKIYSALNIRRDLNFIPKTKVSQKFK